MPFPLQKYHPFTVIGVGWLPEGQPGVYGIFNAIHCIYIGQAQDLKAALMEHVTRRSEDSERIWLYNPTFFQAERISLNSLKNEETRYIQEYRPISG